MQRITIRIWACTCTMLVQAFLCQLVTAHPGHSTSTISDTRSWTDKTGKTIQASFVSQKGRNITLRSETGTLIVLPFKSLVEHEKQWVENKMKPVVHWNTIPFQIAKAKSMTAKTPTAAKAFAAFKKRVKTRWDNDFLFVESNGLPDHIMMVGITNWQQQVPLPQPFKGTNSWQIPLNPKLASKPISAKTNLFRGAIALAVNGVPIFNALNNRGEDAYLIGELDKWGGHCGRGDDYHYHAAPLHLEKIVGKGNPIAYALDGYPIYGLLEPDGSAVKNLDKFNGHFDADGNYHYHASKKYPYINGGLRGVVSVRGGQVDPQPKDSPVRPAGRPLRDAEITKFEILGDNHFRLTYKVRSSVSSIEYKVLKNGACEFTYKDSSGRTKKQTYQRREQNGRRPPPPRRDPNGRPPRRRN